MKKYFMFIAIVVLFSTCRKSGDSGADEYYLEVSVEGNKINYRQKSKNFKKEVFYEMDRLRDTLQNTFIYAVRQPFIGFEIQKRNDTPGIFYDFVFIAAVPGTITGTYKPGQASLAIKKDGKVYGYSNVYNGSYSNFNMTILKIEEGENGKPASVTGTFSGEVARSKESLGEEFDKLTSIEGRFRFPITEEQ